MRDAFTALLTQLRKVWLNRKFVFPIAVVISILGWSVVAVLADVYEGNATLYVDTQTMLGRVLDRVAVDTKELDAEFVALARQRLLARPTIERLIRETDLDLGAETDAEMDRMVNEVADAIDITSASTTGGERARPNIFLLRVQHENPDIAKKMIESMVEIFGDEVLRSNGDSSDQTQQFLEQQIAQYQKRLDETEKRLTEFRRLNVGMMPAEGNSVFNELSTMRRMLDQSRADLSRALAQQSGIRRQLAAMSIGSGETMSANAAMKYEQWAKLNAELQTLLGQYTDQHPQVVAVRRRLEDLNFDPNRTRAPSISPGRGFGDPSMLQLDLMRIEADVATLRAKEGEYQARIGALESSLGSMPEVEAQLQALTRDYDVNKEQYTALVQRRESARLSREAELTTNQVQFQIIEPPHVGTLPVAPQRGLLLTAVFAGALGIAAVIGFLLSQIKPTFGDIRELESVTGLTTLGTIGVVRNELDTRAHRIEYLAYIGVFLVLILAYVGLVVWLADDFKSFLR